MIICNPRQLSPSAGFVLFLLSSPPSSLHLCSNSVPTSGFLGFLPGLPWVNDAQLTGHPVRMPRLRISICQDRERAGPPLHGCSCTWGAGPSLRSAGAHTHSHHQTHSDNYMHTQTHTYTHSQAHSHTSTHSHTAHTGSWVSVPQQHTTHAPGTAVRGGHIPVSLHFLLAGL